MDTQARTALKKLASPRRWAYGLFWSWNITFLAFMLLGFAPELLPEVITAVRAGEIPLVQLVYAGVLIAVPVVAVALGLTLLRRSPGRLLALGVGVEGPLMLGLAIRFFLLRDATPPVALLLWAGVLGTAALLWQILDRRIDTRGALLTHARVVGLTILLLAGLYVGTWIAFYAVPLADVGWSSIIAMLRDPPEGQWIMLWILGGVLLAYTATLFLAAPAAAPLAYLWAWWRGVRALATRHGRPRATALVLTVAAICAVLFVQANRQPQHLAFALLETPPATPAEARTLMARQDEIRAGLLNAYLARYRYVGAVGNVFHVREMYRYLGMKQDGITEVQRLYGIVARPLLYTPVGIARAEESQDAHPFSVEPIEAARLYEAYFDRDILTGERDVIAATLRLNWSADQAQAGRRAFDDHEVYLTRQEISIVENGDWAEVELHEIYRNRTRVRQEVVYYFSLPESAVITGVWLGNNPDRDARFVYRVAPRGAAQATYRNELRYWADPALAEQIGPRQYRLRIYPVQQRRIHYNRTTDIREVKEGRPLHVWLTYRVLASGRAWPLPRLAEKRNVYWDAGTIRLVNGEAMAPGLESWLPPSVPASSPVEPVAHRVDLGTGETVVARPVSAVDLPRLPDELRLGVVLDRSRSMATQETRVQQAMTRLAGMMDSGAVIDVYLTASAYRGESPSRASMAKIDLDAITYSGGQNAAELLLQFDALSSGETYDAILVLTDDAGYRAGNGDAEIPIPDAPLWMVHLGGGFPMGYDDATLEAIQASGGGTVASLDEALTRLAVALAGRGSASSRDVIDGYEWRLVPTGSTEAGSEATVDNAFAPFAARRLILATTNRQRNATYRLGALDRVHAIAVEHGIVTPYSSMLVLVDESQHELLDALEAGGDRFLREYEDVGETIPERAIAVGAVPEPEEWLLIALATAMLVWAARRRGIAPGHRRAA